MITRRNILIGAALVAGAAAGYGVSRFVRSKPSGEPPLAGTVADFTLMKEPRPMPLDPFSDETGAERTMADYLGRIVLVNFWATWCVPCKIEMPALDRLEGAMGGPDFAVLPIALDREGAEKVLPFYEATELENLPVAIDADNGIANALGIQALPTTILVNRDGMGVGYYLGDAEWDSSDAQDLMRWFIEQGRETT